MKEEIIQKAREFEISRDIKEKVAKGKTELGKFLRKYPFRKNPQLIDSLTAQQIYNPGADDYFFVWIEQRTKSLGAILTYGGLAYPSAIEKLEKFKQLLRITVDETKPISEKIDAEWEALKGFGGDKLIAKKTLFCYFSEEVVPIFKTEHLERFCRELDIDYRTKALEECGGSFEGLSIGVKFELLNKLLLKFKDQNLPSWDSSHFTRFLYDEFRPEKTHIPSRRRSEALHKLGLLYEPCLEQEVVYLFSILHGELGFPYIVRFQEKFPDVTVMDKDRNTVRIEIEVLASEFNHDPTKCDFIVCWENDMADLPETFPEIVSLKDYLNEYR